MSDSTQTLAERSVSRDLKATAEPFEVTPDLVAANLSFGDELMELPDEMMSAMRRIYLDRDFVWPTTVAVTRVEVTAGPDRARPSNDVWTRISVLGTGFDADRPVALSLANAAGYADGTAPLVEANADASGFLGANVTLRTVPRRSIEWGRGDDALVLVAQQTGDPARRAEFTGLPPHVLWQWVR